MLHSSEWLDQAKQVPVGQKRRVRHGAECTKAMDVYNNEDSWSSYCHRCHDSGFVRKEVLEKPDTSVPVFRKYLDYNKCLTLSELAVRYPKKYCAVVVLLQEKGVSTTILEPYKPMYCLTDDRLVFRFKGVDLGRDCTGRSPMKWFKYHNDSSKEFVYLQGKNGLVKGSYVVICEDLFSCAKITHYTGLSTMCLLGTRFEDAKVAFCLRYGLRVLGAFDGDTGGDGGHRIASDRCLLLDIQYQRVDIPRDKDPKDLKPKELINLFKEFTYET